MSIKLMTQVWDSDLARDEKSVLLAYADHAADDGSCIYPSMRRMSWKTGYSERSVQRITRKLQAKGVVVHDGNGPHGVNRWCIVVDKLPQRPPYNTQQGDKMSPLAIDEGDTLSSPGDKNDMAGATPCHPPVTKTTEEGVTVSPNPSLESSLDPSLESPVESDAPPQTETPDERLARLREKFGTDPLDFMAKQAERDNGRPLGWTRVSDRVWEVCQEVADKCGCRMPVIKPHHNDNTQERVRQDIDVWSAGAEILADIFEENGQDAASVLAGFMLNFDNGFTLAGPQSLVRAVPAFLARGSKDTEPAGFAGLRQWAQQEGWT